ncbi:MAG: DUF4038 domain-containing protein [Planctomycetes bacterium]|nr:DUF4038 domain-containing protein [Planctomycetota bacterium]
MLTLYSVWMVSACLAAPPERVTMDAPTSVGRYDLAEFTVRVADPPFGNPFTEADLTGEFTLTGGKPIAVRGFCDSQDGSVLRLRFCPDRERATYEYHITLKGGGLDKTFSGKLECSGGDRAGPVIVDPQHRKHFIHAGTGKPFYHLGYTAYHLMDPRKTDEQVNATIGYCVREGFNKVRFLLAGYPRDAGGQVSKDAEHGVPEPQQAPNYGTARPINPLPAWLGEPHHYDFARFDVAYWQRIDRAVRRMRDAGIVATCIVTIEKQRLPREYGRLTEAEYRLYRYAVARLAAFDNVWWDLGNEHNEYRDTQWGNTMGAFVKQEDPYDRLLSAHGYADFLYPQSDWAGFIITQQYGTEKEVRDWVLKYKDVPKPYVNEEYGYEGDGIKNQKGKPNAPGHGQSADWTRRCHWSIAMAGGYATYGDWSKGVSYFYMGDPGPGVAALQLKHLRSFFEALPYRDLEVHDEYVTGGFCLAVPGEHYVFYFPGRAEAKVDLASAAGRRRLETRWFGPRTGWWTNGPDLTAGENVVTVPEGGDWVLYVRAARSRRGRGRRPESGAGRRAEMPEQPALRARSTESQDWTALSGAPEAGLRLGELASGGDEANLDSLVEGGSDPAEHGKRMPLVVGILNSGDD